jgi:hypothetical protein
MLARSSAVHDPSQPLRSLLEFVGSGLAGVLAARGLVLAAVLTTLEVLKGELKKIAPHA